MTKKSRIITGTILIIILLLSLSLLSKDAMRTIKHGYFPIETSQTALIKYKPHQYDIDDYHISFAVPDSTEVSVSSDQGTEMQFSTYLVNSELAFRGYIQLWKIKDLEHFLSYSKSLSPFDFRSYKVSNLQKSEYHGFITEWTTQFGQGLMSGKEYWLKINNTQEVLRVSILTDTAELPSRLQNVIQQIVDSLQIDMKSLI